MQMVGRGLRSKDDGGDCLILDLADNTKEHGFPETRREWKLEPRGSQPSGEALVVWCPKCYAESHAASNCCSHCEYPLGQECIRCKWGPWRRWQHEKMCDNAHDLVCDLCHADAHVRARLPFSLDLIVPMEDLLPEERPPKRLSKTGGYWHLLSSETESAGFKPRMLCTPDGEEIPVWKIEISRRHFGFPFKGPGDYVYPRRRWKYLSFEVAEWLIQNERLQMELIPIKLGPKRHVVHTLPEHADGTPFEDWEKPSNGLCLYIPSGSKDICKAVERLNRMSPPSEQFYVQYEQYRRVNARTGHMERCDRPHPELCNHPRY